MKNFLKKISFVILCALVASNSIFAMHGFDPVPAPVYLTPKKKLLTAEEINVLAKRDPSVYSGLILVGEKVYSHKATGKRYTLSEIRDASESINSYVPDGFTRIEEPVYRDKDGQLWPASIIKQASNAHRTSVDNAYAKLIANYAHANEENPTDVPSSTIYQIVESGVKSAGRFAAIKFLGALQVMTQVMCVAIAGYNGVECAFGGANLARVISNSKDKAAMASCAAFVALHFAQMMGAMYFATIAVPEKFKDLREKIEPSQPIILNAMPNQMQQRSNNNR